MSDFVSNQIFKDWLPVKEIPIHKENAVLLADISKELIKEFAKKAPSTKEAEVKLLVMHKNGELNSAEIWVDVRGHSRFHIGEKDKMLVLYKNRVPLVLYKNGKRFPEAGNITDNVGDLWSYYDKIDRIVQKMTEPLSIRLMQELNDGQ